MLIAQIPDPTDVIKEATHYSWEAGLLCFLVMTIVIGIGFLGWKVTWYTVFKILGNTEKGTRGIVGEWVDTEKKDKEANTEALTKISERLEKQTEACSLHVDVVAKMGDNLAQQIEAAKLAQEASTLAATAAAEANKSLSHIDEVLVGRTDMLRRTAEGVQQLKGCVFHVCDLCQALVVRQFPNSAEDVSGYLNAIKKKVNDEHVS